MKKTLIISGHYPLPENSGYNIRTMNFVRFFKKQGPVDLVYSYMQSSGSTFQNEYLLRRKAFPGKCTRIVNYILGLPEGIQYTSLDEQSLLNLISREQYDIILVRYIVNTGALFNLPEKYKRRVIVDFDDVVTGPLYSARIKSAPTFYQRFRIAVDRKCLVRYEKKCFNFGASIFSSESDVSNMIKKFKWRNQYHVPNIYCDETYEQFDFVDGFNNSNTLLFIGTLNYEPNVNGLKWFVETVYPSFREKYSDAKLLVVGRSPSDTVVNMCRKEQNVELHGDAIDLKTFYDQSRAVIVPLLAGSGTRIKILEASLTNRPVLSTPVGAEGLDFTDGKDLLIFKDAGSFINRYDRLSVNSFYNDLISNAHHTVHDRYSLEGFQSAVGRVVDSIQ